MKKWIYKPGVEEVNINAYNDIEVIESSGRSIKISDKFSSPQHAIDVIRRMLNACGMVIDDTMPSIVGFLDKNIRISVDKTPIVDADVGVNASIRIVNQQTVSEEKLLNSGSATAEMLHFLTACIRYGVSVCIAGSTGSGKTTIMAWLLSNVPNNRRLITIEEGSREFDLIKRDAQGNILNSVVHLLTRPSENPALNINQDFLLSGCCVSTRMSSAWVKCGQQQKACPQPKVPHRPYRMYHHPLQLLQQHLPQDDDPCQTQVQHG